VHEALKRDKAWQLSAQKKVNCNSFLDEPFECPFEHCSKICINGYFFVKTQGRIIQNDSTLAEMVVFHLSSPQEATLKHWLTLHDAEFTVFRKLEKNGPESCLGKAKQGTGLPKDAYGGAILAFCSSKHAYLAMAYHSQAIWTKFIFLVCPTYYPIFLYPHEK